MLVSPGTCGFKTPEHLCSLHHTGMKPFGCIASPFTLNHRDTLVISNRYRRLVCYKDGGRPAYRAFATSLRLLFGPAEAERITEHLDAGGGDLEAGMLAEAYENLQFRAEMFRQRAGVR
jgi:hypothetical protein